ncbi:neuronal membrane glycoprotein M6-b isoform X2 [Passer domesticus]|uniref:neuronal membrane glycoprotein M6-b isoform X2 n=2 Tax=Passeriformes TaxID=9126 RepID=UPI0030FEBB2B
MSVGREQDGGCLSGWSRTGTAAEPRASPRAAAAERGRCAACPARPGRAGPLRRRRRGRPAPPAPRSRRRRARHCESCGRCSPPARSPGTPQQSPARPGIARHSTARHSTASPCPAPSAPPGPREPAMVITRPEMEIGRYHWMYRSSRPHRYHHVPALRGNISPLGIQGCFECCIKCLGGVPYASLVATILCFSGVALFCGCGHVALTGTVSILEQHFSTTASDHALLSEVIQLMQYVIYGIASFFFLYGIILLAEGFYTTSAVKELHGEFKTTACGRCISGMFVFLTYVLGVAWLGVFGFSAVPVFMFYNIWSTCEVIKSFQSNVTVPGDQICVDIRQYGIIPWNAVPGKACGPILENICNTNEFYMSYHLFIVACAGAGATVIALLIYMMATTYNYAVLKFKSREDCCTKF